MFSNFLKVLQYKPIFYRFRQWTWKWWNLLVKSKILCFLIDRDDWTIFICNVLEIWTVDLQIRRKFFWTLHSTFPPSIFAWLIAKLYPLLNSRWFFFSILKCWQTEIQGKRQFYQKILMKVDPIWFDSKIRTKITVLKIEIDWTSTRRMIYQTKTLR